MAGDFGLVRGRVRLRLRRSAVVCAPRPPQPPVPDPFSTSFLSCFYLPSEFPSPYPTISVSPNTSTLISSYEQLKARAAAYCEAPVPPEQSRAPAHPGDGMDMDSATDQGPSNDSDGQEGTASNNVDRAAAEFNSVIAAHHTTPAIVGGARAFTRVRSPHLSHSSPDHHIQLQASAKLLHLYLAIEEIRSTVGALTRPDGFGFALPPNLEVHFLSCLQCMRADAEFQENIKTYSIVILAQPALQTYDINILVNYMMVRRSRQARLLITPIPAHRQSLGRCVGDYLITQRTLPTSGTTLQSSHVV